MTAALSHAGSMAYHRDGDLLGAGDGSGGGGGLGDARGLPVELAGTVKKVGVLPN